MTSRVVRIIWLPLLIACGLLYLAGPPPVAHAQIQTQIGLIGATRQQAVTGTAAALAAMPTTVLCIKALPANTLTVYWSTSSTVTTSTGFPLAASETSCIPVRDASLIYVVSSTTGSGVAWFNTIP